MIYVADSGDLSIKMYAPNADGDVAPIAEIAGPHTALFYPLGIAVSTTGRIYESDGDTNSLHVYPPSANGDVSPIQTIAGPNTGISGPTGLAVYEPSTL